MTVNEDAIMESIKSKLDPGYVQQCGACYGIRDTIVDERRLLEAHEGVHFGITTAECVSALREMGRLRLK